MNNIKVILDPGHGGYEPGAVKFGVSEKDINLVLGRKVAQSLEDLAIPNTLTRTTDRYISLQDRVKYANTKDASCFVSLHCNSFVNENAFGLEVYHYGSHKGITLATYVYNNILTTTHQYSRGTKFGSFYVLQYTAMPAILIEYGFLSNPVENKRLQQSIYQDSVAWSTALGIQKYLMTF